ncbi:hypothetical protein IW140_005435 [Coemansia sp. RSA 1813]|nr:hypothetical protein IW140_005435 [Coemansia sp. RSA 1813]
MRNKVLGPAGTRVAPQRIGLTRKQQSESAVTTSSYAAQAQAQAQAQTQTQRPGTLLSRTNSAHGSRAAPSSAPRPGAADKQPRRNNGAVSPVMPRSSGSTRMLGSPVAEPFTYKSQSLRGLSRIPRPAIPALGDDTSDYSRRRMIFEINRNTEEQLANERAAVNELLNELKTMARVTESLNEDVATARANTEEANSRADRAESQLCDQQAENAALKQKIEALSEVIYTQTTVCGDGLPSPDRSHGVSAGLMVRQSDGTESDTNDRQQQDDAAGWHADHARMVAAIGVIHANCTLAQPESEMDPSVRRDLDIVERYLERAANTDPPDIPGGNVDDGEDILSPPVLFSPPPKQRRAASSNIGTDEARLPVSSRGITKQQQQQRWVDEQEERAMRRRSTMLFAGLIRPSVGSSARPESEQALSPHALDDTVAHEEVENLACGRCLQLLETLQALEIDNDYYREANRKLRGSVTDVISRHNALVHIFERERVRRMDARASALARASRIAVRDRAQLEAHTMASWPKLSNPPFPAAT